MKHSSYLTGFLLGAPLALTVAAVVLVSNLFPLGSFRAQVENGGTCNAGSAGVVRMYGNGVISRPTGITQGSDGNLWFILSNNAIGKMATNGTLVAQYPVPTSAYNNAITAIASDAHNNVWFGASTNNSPLPPSHYIGKMASNGAVIRYDIPQNSVDGAIISMTRGSDDNIWFYTNGGWLFRITQAGVITRYDNGPGHDIVAMTVGSDGLLWLAGTNISRMNADVSFTRYGLPTPGALVTSIAAGADGRLWFTEHYLNSNFVGAITTEGVATQYDVVSNTNGAAGGMTAGSDGNLYFFESTSGPYNFVIARLNTSGAVTGTSSIQSTGRVAGMTSGPDGNIWLTDYEGAIGTLVLCSGASSSTSSETSLSTSSNTASKSASLSSCAASGSPEITQVPFRYRGEYIGTPNQIASAPDGTLWVTMGARNTIAKTMNGSISSVFTVPTTGFGEDIAYATDGTVWFTISPGKQIGKIAADGTISLYTVPGVAQHIIPGLDGTMWFTQSNAPTGAGIGRVTSSGQITVFPISFGPIDLTMGADGNIWFIGGESTGQSRIGRMTTAGVVTEFPAGFRILHSITTGSDGNVWIGGISDDITVGLLVARVSHTGTVTQFSLHANISGVTSITSGPDGNLWFLDSGLRSTNHLVRVTLDGVATAYSINASEVYTKDIVFAGNTIWFTDMGSEYLGKVTPASCSSSSKSSIVSPPLSSTRLSTSSSASSIRPDICTPICGDNLKVGPEECDDGNTKNGDGCSANCKKETVSSSARSSSPSSVRSSASSSVSSSRSSAVSSTVSSSRSSASSIISDHCIGNACVAGAAFCALSGKECRFDAGKDACFTCDPGPPFVCSNTMKECNDGGSKYCKIAFGQGSTCIPDDDEICIQCLQPGQCSGTDWECKAGGGDKYCSDVFGSACSAKPDSSLCIQCGNPIDPFAQCPRDACRKGSANICNQKGQGCMNTSDGMCAVCTPSTTCVDDLQCAEGSSCVNGSCTATCGNGRVDAGEACDGGEGCTASCYLDENQFCTRDTECASTLCIRNSCVPCTTGNQCQSNECRDGACTNLCGNGTLNRGEICDAASSAECTSDCLRALNAACSYSQECGSALCENVICLRCSRNDQCASNLCVSGSCVDTCGNGSLNGVEECDDGNRISGDGCSRFCARDTLVAAELLPVTLMSESTNGGNAYGIPTGAGGGVGGVNQLSGLATGHPAAGKTGPAAVVAIAAGAAAGWSYMRRRRRNS